MFNQLDFVHSCSKWLERVILNETPEAPLHRCYYENGVLKICSKLQGNTHAVVWATSLKSHFSMGVLLYICCIFLEYHVLRTPLQESFWNTNLRHSVSKKSVLTIWLLLAKKHPNILETFRRTFKIKPSVIFCNVLLQSN